MCVHARMHVSVCVCVMYVCVYHVCMYVCIMYVCMCVRECVGVCMCVRIVCLYVFITSYSGPVLYSPLCIFVAALVRTWSNSTKCGYLYIMPYFMYS